MNWKVQFISKTDKKSITDEESITTRLSKISNNITTTITEGTIIKERIDAIKKTKTDLLKNKKGGGRDKLKIIKSI